VCVQIDVGLVLKLQQKLKDVEKERNRLQKRVEHLEKEDSPSDDAARTHDSFKVCVILSYNCTWDFEFSQHCCRRVKSCVL
jgi:hypothetical protein